MCKQTAVCLTKSSFQLQRFNTACLCCLHNLWPLCAPRATKSVIAGVFFLNLMIMLHRLVCMCLFQGFNEVVLRNIFKPVAALSFLRCEGFLKRVSCFYRCSPDAARWPHPDRRSYIQAVPLCHSFCRDW